MALATLQVLRDKKRMLEGFSRFTGRPYEALEQDFKRNFYLDANEAKAYGLIDKILGPKRSEDDKPAFLDGAAFGSFAGAGEQQDQAEGGAPSKDDAPPPLTA